MRPFGTDFALRGERRWAACADWVRNAPFVCGRVPLILTLTFGPPEPGLGQRWIAIDLCSFLRIVAGFPSSQNVFDRCAQIRWKDKAINNLTDSKGVLAVRHPLASAISKFFGFTHYSLLRVAALLSKAATSSGFRLPGDFARNLKRDQRCHASRHEPLEQRADGRSHHPAAARNSSSTYYCRDRARRSLTNFAWSLPGPRVFS